MSDVKTMGSIADKLLSYVNTALVHDTNYQIAASMLNHYDKLEKMTLSEMAELCFVSKSAITRYCHFLGFNDFSEFRDALEQKFDMGEDYTKQFQKQMHENSKEAIECFGMQKCVSARLFRLFKLPKKWDSKRLSFLLIARL